MKVWKQIYNTNKGTIGEGEKYKKKIEKERSLGFNFRDISHGVGRKKNYMYRRREIVVNKSTRTRKCRILIKANKE